MLFPSGDEPHYLVIAQSLWRDGDLKIENNHKRGDYAEYFGRDLDPHYLTRGSDREIYSIHPVGMPVLITPIMALGGYTLVVAWFILMAATAAAAAWRWTLATTGAVGPTTLAWAAIAFSAPFLINSFTIYPEVPAALVMALALPLVLRPTPDTRNWHGWAIGMLAATLPWLSTKYAPMSAAMVAVAVLRRWWPIHASHPRATWLGGALPIVVPYAASLLAWATFFYAYWGTPWPQAPYGSMAQTEVAFTVFGVPGLLFDQEYGLLAYAPAYVLAGFGLWTMIRRPGALRRLGLEIGVILAALTFTVGAFRIWWGGSAAPGRPMVAGLLVMMLPMAVQIGSARAGSPRRAAQHVLAWAGVVVAAILIVAQDGLLVANGRDGTSSLLEWLSPRWPLWTLFPTFIAHEAGPALLDSAVWIAGLALGSWLLTRWSASTRGLASLRALATAVAVVVVAVVARGALPDPQPPLPGVDLRARARLTALDSFDHIDPSLRPAVPADSALVGRRGRADVGGQRLARIAARAAAAAGIAQRPILAAGRALPGGGALGRARSAAGPGRVGDCPASGTHRPAVARMAGDAGARRRVDRGVLAADRRRIRRLSWIERAGAFDRGTADRGSRRRRPRVAYRRPIKCSRRQRTATRLSCSTTSRPTRNAAASGPRGSAARVRRSPVPMAASTA